MKKGYDFSKGQRGKFHHPDVKFNIPVYLDEDNMAFVEQIADRKKTDVSTVVNELIRTDKRIAKAME